jgi:hypothetical protein
MKYSAVSVLVLLSAVAALPILESRDSTSPGESCWDLLKKAAVGIKARLGKAAETALVLKNDLNKNDVSLGKDTVGRGFMSEPPVSSGPPAATAAPGLWDHLASLSKIPTTPGRSTEGHESSHASSRRCEERQGHIDGGKE